MNDSCPSLSLHISCWWNVGDGAGNGMTAASSSGGFEGGRVCHVPTHEQVDAELGISWFTVSVHRGKPRTTPPPPPRRRGQHVIVLRGMVGRTDTCFGGMHLLLLSGLEVFPRRRRNLLTLTPGKAWMVVALENQIHGHGHGNGQGDATGTRLPGGNANRISTKTWDVVCQPRANLTRWPGPDVLRWDVFVVALSLSCHPRCFRFQVSTPTYLSFMGRCCPIPSLGWGQLECRHLRKQWHQRPRAVGGDGKQVVWSEKWHAVDTCHAAQVSRLDDNDYMT